MDAIIGNGKISKREYEIIAERDIMIPVRDGVKLCADVFRPADDKGKFPALIALVSFNKEVQSARVWPGASRSRRINGTPDAAIEAGAYDFFVRRGYVEIICSERGTGKSGGKYSLISPQDIEDAYDIIEWAAAQPWCNGSVGMLGSGDTAIHHGMVAVLQPPHLKAIAPIGTYWDLYREFWWPGGILFNGFLRWLISLVNLDVHTEECILKGELGEAGYKEAIAQALEDEDICADPDLVEALKNPVKPCNTALLEILLRPLYDSFWKERTVTEFDKIKVRLLSRPPHLVPARFTTGLKLMHPKG